MTPFECELLVVADSQQPTEFAFANHAKLPIVAQSPWALQQFEKANSREPDSAELPLWIYLTRIGQGKEIEAARLLQNSQDKLRTPAWAASVGAAFLGNLSAEQCIREPLNAECEKLIFYIAARDFARSTHSGTSPSSNEEILRLLEDYLRLGDTSQLESIAANELARLIRTRPDDREAYQLVRPSALQSP